MAGHRRPRVGARHREQLRDPDRTTSYDAWGNPQTAGGLTAATPSGYAGVYTDPTGLIYLINRYYDPATGQFTSVDRMLSQTLAPYSNADGNPIPRADRDGLTYIMDLTDWLEFDTPLWQFLAIRWSNCGSNWPVIYSNGMQNCWWLGNSGGRYLDWGSDGCSWAVPWQVLPWWAGHAAFWEACERHDFGYRNYREQWRFYLIATASQGIIISL